MASRDRPHLRSEFEIAVICALSLESDAVEAVFDEKWEYTFGKAPGDPNTYATGRIGGHNVVLVFLPGIGKASAASATASLLSSFPCVKLSLVVGICGGVPNDPTDVTKEILLGDVIISTGIVQYDFGRQFPNKVVRKDNPQDVLSRPSKEVRSFLHKIGGVEARQKLQHDTLLYLEILGLKREFKCPRRDEDILFESAHRHKHYNPTTCDICARCVTNSDETCNDSLNSSCDQLGCSEGIVVVRRRLLKGSITQKPQIHFGFVASGDLVIKSGYHRDEIARKESVIAFEMEGAGVWDNLPTVIIKGACDYADSHKTKSWQKYAAESAAAGMKAFLGQWATADKPPPPEMSPTTYQASTQTVDSVCREIFSTHNPTTEVSLLEAYDYVHFSVVVVIWNLQKDLGTRRFIAGVLLALDYLWLNPLSPLAWRCVKFEDALGRMQRLPFELCRNHDAFGKFLLAEFKERPGWHQVVRKEYVIASRKFGGAIITPEVWLDTVQPGGMLTMSIRVDTDGKWCPRCRRELSEAETRCTSCLQYLWLLLGSQAMEGRSAGPRTLEEHVSVDISCFKYTYSSRDRVGGVLVKDQSGGLLAPPNQSHLSSGNVLVSQLHGQDKGWMMNRSRNYTNLLTDLLTPQAISFSIFKHLNIGLMVRRSARSLGRKKAPKRSTSEPDHTLKSTQCPNPFCHISLLPFEEEPYQYISPLEVEQDPIEPDMRPSEYKPFSRI